MTLHFPERHEQGNKEHPKGTLATDETKVYLHEGRLSRSVGTEHPDLCSRVEGEVDVLQYGLGPIALAVRLRQAVHLVHEILFKRKNDKNK